MFSEFIVLTAGTAILSLIVDVCTFFKIIFDIIKDKQKVTFERIRLGYAIMGACPSFTVATITYFIPFFNLFSSFSKRHFYKEGKRKFDSLFSYFKKTKDSIVQGKNKLYPLDAHEINMNLSFNSVPTNTAYQISCKNGSKATIYCFDIINGMAVLDRNSPLNDSYSLLIDSANLREILKRISLYLGSTSALELDNIIKEKREFDINFTSPPKDIFPSGEISNSVLELYSPSSRVKKLTRKKDNS